MSKNPFNVLKMYFDKVLLDSDDTGLECLLYISLTIISSSCILYFQPMKQVQKQSFIICHYGKSYEKSLVNVQKLPKNLC